MNMLLPNTIFFCWFFIFILNPTLRSGVSLGAFCALAAMTFIFMKRMVLYRFLFIVGLVLLTLFSINILIGVLLGSWDIRFINSMVSPTLSLFFGYYLSRIAPGYYSAERLSMFFILVISINSGIILLEFFYPPMRAFIEGLLIQETQISYDTHMFRFRGLATSGGANLSLAVGLSAVLVSYLYINKCVSVVTFFVLLPILLISLLVIGRTGLIIFFLGIGLLILTNSHKNQIRMLFSIGGLVAASFALLSVAYFMLDAKVVKYALPMFFALSEDKSMDAIYSFYNLDLTVIDFLFGKGQYSGNVGYMNTDVGFFKILTSVGVPIGVFLYSSTFYIAFKSANFVKNNIPIIIVLLLFVSEIKEPLLFKGYSARYFWFLIGAMCGLQHQQLPHMGRFKREVKSA
jgi:hypothetical protein